VQGGRVSEGRQGIKFLPKTVHSEGNTSTGRSLNGDMGTRLVIARRKYKDGEAAMQDHTTTFLNINKGSIQNDVWQPEEEEFVLGKTVITMKLDSTLLTLIQDNELLLVI
jgi:hypothetical protein